MSEGNWLYPPVNRGWNYSSRTASLTIRPDSITHDSPTFQFEKRINPESCSTFSPTVYPRCGGAVTGAVGGAMYGSQLAVYGWDKDILGKG